MITICLGAVIATLPRAAGAQPRDVERLHLEGMALRQAGRNSEAAALFQALYERTNEPRALARWGLALAAQGEWVRAEALIQRAIAVDGDRWIAENREGLERNLARVREQLAASPNTSLPPAPREPSSNRTQTPAASSVPGGPGTRQGGARRSAGIVLSALGGAGIVLGVVGVALRTTEAERFNSRGCLLFADRDEVVGGFAGCTAAYRSGSMWEGVGVAGLAAGGVLAATGLILWATAGSGSSDRHAGFRCVPDLTTPGLQCAAAF